MVKKELRPGDFLINWNSASHHIWETKFYGIGAPIYIPPGSGDLPFFVGTALMEDDDIIREIPEWAERVGVITTGPIEEINVHGYTESGVVSVDRIKFVILSKDVKKSKQ